jgi:hypothetical protein
MSEEEKAGTVEEEIMDSASKQCTSSQLPLTFTCSPN